MAQAFCDMISLNAFLFFNEIPITCIYFTESPFFNVICVCICACARARARVCVCVCLQCIDLLTAFKFQCYNKHNY